MGKKSKTIAARIADLEMQINPSGVEIHTLAYLRWLLAEITSVKPNPWPKPRV